MTSKFTLIALDIESADSATVSLTRFVKLCLRSMTSRFGSSQLLAYKHRAYGISYRCFESLAEGVLSLYPPTQNQKRIAVNLPRPTSHCKQWTASFVTPFASEKAALALHIHCFRH